MATLTSNAGRMAASRRPLGELSFGFKRALRSKGECGGEVRGLADAIHGKVIRYKWRNPHQER